MKVLNNATKHANTFVKNIGTKVSCRHWTKDQVSSKNVFSKPNIMIMVGSAGLKMANTQFTYLNTESHNEVICCTEIGSLSNIRFYR